MQTPINHPTLMMSSQIQPDIPISRSDLSNHAPLPFYAAPASQVDQLASLLVPGFTSVPFSSNSDGRYPFADCHIAQPSLPSSQPLFCGSATTPLAPEAASIDFTFDNLLSMIPGPPLVPFFGPSTTTSLATDQDVPPTPRQQKRKHSGIDTSVLATDVRDFGSSPTNGLSQSSVQTRPKPCPRPRQQIEEPLPSPKTHPMFRREELFDRAVESDPHSILSGSGPQTDMNGTNESTSTCTQVSGEALSNEVTSDRVSNRRAMQNGKLGAFSCLSSTQD